VVFPELHVLTKILAYQMRLEFRMQKRATGPYDENHRLALESQVRSFYVQKLVYANLSKTHKM